MHLLLAKAFRCSIGEDSGCDGISAVIIRSTELNIGPLLVVVVFNTLPNEGHFVPYSRGRLGQVRVSTSPRPSPTTGPLLGKVVKVWRVLRRVGRIGIQSASVFPRVRDGNDDYRRRSVSIIRHNWRRVGGRSRRALPDFAPGLAFRPRARLRTLKLLLRISCEWPPGIVTG